MTTINKFLFLLIGILICGNAVAQAKTSVGDVSVKFPAEPRKIEHEDWTEYRITNQSLGYIILLAVQSSDVPKEDEREALQKRVDYKLTTGIDKKNVQTTDIKLAGYDGKEIRYSGDLAGNSSLFTCRIFIIDNTTYELEFCDIFGAGLESMVATEFFESVELN
jgi:hypothetical protein